MTKRTKIIIGVVICIIWGLFIYTTYETFYMKYWFRDYDNWETVTIKGCGGILIPEGWKVDIEEGLLYIRDENDKIIFVESKLALEDESVRNNKSEKNAIGEISYIKGTDWNTMSNGVTHGEADIIVDGKEKEVRYIYGCL